MFDGFHGQRWIRQPDARVGVGDPFAGGHRCVHCLGLDQRLSRFRHLNRVVSEAATGLLSIPADLVAEFLQA